AGNSTLMTDALKTTLCDHAAGNHRALTTMAGQLLAVAAERNLAQLDEKLYFEVFAPPDPRKRRVGATRPATLPSTHGQLERIYFNEPGGRLASPRSVAPRC